MNNIKNIYAQRFSYSYKRLAFLVVLLLSGAFCILRSFYGFDWSDETYAGALTYRFMIGDSLFVNSWDIHQTSAIITIPLIYIYQIFSSGSTVGILLFLRISYVVIQLLTALYVFHVLSKRNGYTAAAAAALLLILFAPTCVASFNYNTLSLTFAVLSLCLLFDCEHEAKWCRLKVFFSGIALALCIQSYPYLIVLLPVFLIYSLTLRRRNPDVIGKWTALFWFVGVFSAFVVFALYICLNSSVTHLFDNLGFLLSDPEHHPESMSASLYDYIVSFYKLLKSAIIGIVVLTILSFGFSFMRDSNKKRIIRKVLFLASAIMVIWCLVYIFIYSVPNASRINLLVIPIALIGPAIYFINDRKYDPSIYLYIIGLLFSLAVHLGSNNQINHTAFPLLLSSMAVVAYCGTMRLKSSNTKAWFYVTASLFILAFVMTAGSMASTRAMYAYRDNNVNHLTSKMENGPAAGIYTTADSARKYEEIVSAINTYAPESGHAFYTKLLPFGYLCSDLRPATPSIWRTPFNSPRLNQYHALHPELKPDFIFVVNEDYGITNQNNPIEGDLTEYIRQEEFREIALDCGIIYIRD